MKRKLSGFNLEMSPPRKKPLKNENRNGLRRRQRRTASEIDRKYKCPIKECEKSYGSESALKMHMRNKHPDQYMFFKELKEKNEASLESKEKEKNNEEIENMLSVEKGKMMNPNTDNDFYGNINEMKYNNNDNDETRYRNDNEYNNRNDNEYTNRNDNEYINETKFKNDNESRNEYTNRNYNESRNEYTNRNDNEYINETKFKNESEYRNNNEYNKKK